jgi:hypothetical protein
MLHSLTQARFIGILSEEVSGAVRISGGVDGRYIGQTSFGCQQAL